ncbi:hypothetical protein D3C81_1978340 [compost metagenome]
MDVGIPPARVVGLPGDHVAAIDEGGDVGGLLTARGGGVDAGFSADLGAAGIEALEEDAIGVAGAVTVPDHQIAAIGQGRYTRVPLIT